MSGAAEAQRKCFDVCAQDLWDYGIGAGKWHRVRERLFPFCCLGADASIREDAELLSKMAIALARLDEEERLMGRTRQA